MSQTTQPAPTASMTVSAGQAGVFPVAFGYYPVEGSRCVSAQYSWLAQSAYAEDLSQLVARGVETTIQGAYIDNSTCSVPVTIIVQGTDQVITVPANAQGAYPLFFTGTPALQISVPAVNAGVTRFYYLNMPIGLQTWLPAGQTTFLGTYLAAPPELANTGTSGLLLDSYGSLSVDTENNVPVYSSAVLNVTPVATPTELFTITGSATKTIRVHEIALFTIAAAAIGSIAVTIYRRSALPTAGSNENMPIAPHDTNNPAATGQTLYWYANPTGFPGTNNAVENFWIDSATTVAQNVFTYGATDQSLVLRGTGQNLGINFGGQTMPSGVGFAIKFKWSEV